MNRNEPNTLASRRTRLRAFFTRQDVGTFVFLLLVLTPAYFYDTPLRELWNPDIPQTWMLADYVPRVITLYVIFLIPALRHTAIGRGKPFQYSFWRVVALFLYALFIFLIGIWCGKLIDPYFPGIQKDFFPVFESRLLHWFDLTFGLLLVAVHEELVYRKLFVQLIGPVLPSRVWTVIVGSVLFGLIHWETGVGNTVAGFLTGVVFMIIYLRAGNLIAPVIVHYLVNLYIFGVMAPVGY